MSDLETTINLLQSRRVGQISSQPAKFERAIIKLLAEGKPVSAQRVANVTGDPVEFVTTAFHQLHQCGCEFNQQGEIIGSALTLTPTHHRLEVDGVTLYAWCALDTLFLPAYIGKEAVVTSTCPVTNTAISLTVAPDGIVALEPAETVLSIMTAQHCTSGIEGTFCGQVFFFASSEAAQQWIGHRPDFAILTVAEAYQLAQKLYIEPVMQSP